MPEPIEWPEGTPDHLRRPVPGPCRTCARLHPTGATSPPEAVEPRRDSSGDPQ